jgi:hypothetical protein
VSAPVVVTVGGQFVVLALDATRCYEGRFRQGSTCACPDRKLFAVSENDRW